MQSGLLTTYDNNISNKSAIAWALSGLLLTFYILMYFTEVFIPLANALHMESKWTLYGTLYTLAIVIGGAYVIRRHGNSRYHKIRTLSVIFFQVVFAFSLPFVMEIFETPGYNFAIFWPLQIDYFYPSKIVNQPLPFILYSLFGGLILVPVLTFLIGKRWYCSWVCGCGGLAETAGEPFRHLSNKSSGAWKFEQISIHSVMLLAFATRAIVIANWILAAEHGENYAQNYPLFSAFAGKIEGFYGLVVGAVLSGVLGVGLYPLMGSRVWCRFFCPLAAIMGMVQKFGRFRITVKDNMCISCGNCSTYCEMGIDVRAYAQTNQSFKRASCVGCGMCAHVCPRGVLKLENKWDFASWGETTKIKAFDM